MGVAELLWGKPRAGGTKTEQRFGDGRTVNPVKGLCFVHGENVGGGVLWLIEREVGLKGRDGIEWLRSHGFPIEDDPKYERRAAPERRQPAAQPVRRQQTQPAADKPDDGARKELVRTWDYVDEAGKVLYQTIRFQFRLPDKTWRVGEDGKPEKTYSQRRVARPDDDPEKVRDGWVYSLAGARIVPYRLPDLIEAVKGGDRIFFVEGEKAADALWELGVPATCNPMGAGKWWDELTPFFVGADVVIIPDNDPQAINKATREPLFHADGRPKRAGIDHAEAVFGKLRPVAKAVGLLDLPGLPLKGDAWDWIMAGGSAEKLYDLALTVRPPEARPQPRFISRFGALRWRDLDAPGPEHEYLIDDFLTVGDKSVIGGPSKSGKSFLAIHAGMSVARGVDFFGRPVRRGLVIYQAGEGARGVKKRLRAYRKHFGVPADEDVPFVLLQSKIDLYRADGDTAALIEEIKAICQFYPEYPLAMFFIDTLATAQGAADENSGKDMGAVLDNIDRINRETGAHVCLVHHMNAQGSKLRGHTSIISNLDQAIFVTRDETTKVRTVTLDKQKDDADGINFRFELMSIEIGSRPGAHPDDLPRPITSCVVVDVGQKAKAVEERAKGFKLSVNESVVFRALLDALRTQGEQAPSSLRLPLGTKVVRASHWKKAFEAIALIEIGEENDEEAQKRRADAIRKQIKRAGESLLKFNIIGRSEPFVWWTGKAVLGFPETYDRTNAPDQRPEPPFEADQASAYADTDDSIQDLIG